MNPAVAAFPRASAWPRNAFARAALVLLGLLLLAAATQPLWLGPLLARQLAASSGRSVSFDSIRVGLTSDFDPVLRCRGIRIANAAWADSTRPFAALGEFDAVASWRTLFRSRVVIRLMVLRDGEVDLERQADGLRNWRLRDPENRGPGRYTVLALQAERAAVRFSPRRLDLVVDAKASPNGDAATAATMPTRLDLTGHWRQVAFTSRLTTGSVLTFLGTDTLFPVRGGMDAGGSRLALDGRAGDIFREPLYDGHLVLAGDALAPFASFLGPRYDHAPQRAFRVEGRFTASDHAYALTAAKARIGATDLDGEVSIGRTRAVAGAPPGASAPASANAPASEPASAPASTPIRRTLRARLHSELLDVADLRWLAGSRAAGQPAPASTAAGNDAPPAFARQLDGALSYEARQLRAGEATWLRSLKLEAALADGRVTVSNLDLGVMQGHVTGRVDADLRASPMSVEGEASLQGLRIESLLGGAAEKKRVTGALRVQARGRAAGDTAAALLASASGHVTASLSGGTLASLLDAEIGLQGGKIVRSLIGGSEPVPIRCASVSMDVREGAGRLRSLVLDTERTRTTGTGAIDLRTETLDVVLTPEAKQGGLFVLDRSIRLHGPLKKPERELVARAAVPARSAACPA